MFAGVKVIFYITNAVLIHMSIAKVQLVTEENELIIHYKSMQHTEAPEVYNHQ